jgi:hypothetical protein
MQNDGHPPDLIAPVRWASWKKSIIVIRWSTIVIALPVFSV